MNLIELTLKDVAVTMALNVDYIVEVVEREDASSTVVTRFDAPNYDVFQSVSDIVSASCGQIVPMTKQGVNVGINRTFIRRVLPATSGKAVLVLDTESSFESDEDYSALLPLFSSCSVAPAPSTFTNKYQSYPNSQTNVLAWTANGGVLPSTDQDGNIIIFQNGQFLEPTIQYVVSGASEFTIDPLTHFNGANYVAIALVSS